MKLNRLFMLFAALLLVVGVYAQNMMPIPPHTNVYNNQARGFWFVAPTTFVITGLRVPTEAGTGAQALQVVKINDPMPIGFGTQSSNFQTLFYTNSGPNGQIVPTNILINGGDTIGILGTAGISNSYGNGAYNSDIFGTTVSIQRFGYQGNINTGQTNQIWGVAYQGGGNISRVEVYYDIAVVNDYPYCQSFEGDDGGWVSGGIQSSWEHGTPNNTAIANAADGVDAWVTDLDGDHNNDEFSTVTSPEFDLTGLIDPHVRFMVNHELQSGQDGSSFQVSNDGGNNYTTLGSTSSPAPWYNGTVPLLAFFGDVNGWTGNSSGWTEMIHSLSGYANDTTIFFRYTMATNSSNANEGFGFDDMVVAESNDLDYVDLIAPDSVCGSSATEIAAVICNKSVTERTGFSVVLDTGGTNITVNYTDTIPICGCDTISLLTFNSAQGVDWDIESYIQNNGDVNASNDSASQGVFLYPIPTGEVFGGGNFCEGDVAQVMFILNGTQPYDFSFSTGAGPQVVTNLASDTFTFNATLTGIHEILALTDASGCPGDTGGFVGQANLVFNPAPTVDLGPDTTVCGSVDLDAGAGLTAYSWNTGATTQTITTSQSGTYTVTVVDANGCTNSDDIDIVVNILPAITLDDTVICEGGSFTFNAGAPFQAYLWDDGSTNQLRPPVTGVTTVSVTVTDFNGCEGTASASITAVVPNPAPNVATAYGLAPVTLDAGSGYVAYDWITNATTQTIDVFSSGTYTVTVTDGNGCEGVGEGVANVWPNGVEDVELNDQGIALFPNPATDQVTIVIAESGGGSVSMQVMDMNGKVVVDRSLGQSANGRFQWEVPEHVSSGQYLVRLRNANGEIIGDHRILIR